MAAAAQLEAGAAAQGGEQLGGCVHWWLQKRHPRSVAGLWVVKIRDGRSLVSALSGSAAHCLPSSLTQTIDAAMKTTHRAMAIQVLACGASITVADRI